jgi:ABC-2 type transport system ATP-binding protein
MKTIETKDLVKRFEDVEAAKGINLEIEEGELFGRLGPNGAGKTAAISMLCTIIKPTSGSTTIFGHDVKKEPGTVRGIISIVFQEPSLDGNLTGKENLDFHGGLYKVSRNEVDVSYLLYLYIPLASLKTSSNFDRAIFNADATLKCERGGA